MPGKAATIAIRFIGTPGMVAAVALLLYLDHLRDKPLFLPLLVTAAGVGALAEVYRLFRLKGYRPAAWAGLAALAALLAAPLLRFEMPAHAPALLLALFVFFALVLRHGKFSVEDAAFTLLGFGYVSLIAFVYSAYEFGAQSTPYLVWLLVASKAPDTAAYLVGKAIGRHKMAPVLSPNKTWEGFAAAMAAGVGGGLFVALTYIDWGLPRAALIVLCLCVTLASIAGDLAKSALKRWAGVKNSGFIPEFGGVLDIVDSFLLSAPTAALVLHLLRHLVASA